MSKQRHQIIEAQTLMRNPAEPDAPSRLVQKHLFLRLCIKNVSSCVRFLSKVVILYEFLKVNFQKANVFSSGEPCGTKCTFKTCPKAYVFKTLHQKHVIPYEAFCKSCYLVHVFNVTFQKATVFSSGEPHGTSHTTSAA